MTSRMVPIYRGILRWLSTIFLVVLLFSISSVTSAAESHEWLAGDALRRQLDRPVGIAWTGRSLRDALRRVSDLYEVAIFLDRGVDPSRSVNQEFANTPLRSVIEAIASEQKLAVVWVGPVAYMGPPAAAAQLTALVASRASDIKSLPAARRRALRTRRTRAWNTLATPREIVQTIADEYGVTVTNLDRLPHDLWPAQDLPPLSAAEQLSLLGVGFGLTFAMDRSGTRIDFVSIPRKTASVRDVASDVERRSAKGTGVTGRTKRPGKSRKVYTLKVNAPLRKLLDALSRQAELRLVLDRKQVAEAGIDLEQIITLDVNDVSLDELLTACLRGTGLVFERDGDEVQVRPGHANARSSAD